MTVQLYAVA